MAFRSNKWNVKNMVNLTGCAFGVLACCLAPDSKPAKRGCWRIKKSLQTIPSGVKYFKRERPIRATPISEEFKAIVNDIRNQPFNADAEGSADFVEFIGRSGLGRPEVATLTLLGRAFEP